MVNDRPVFGILLMMGFCVLAPMSDAVAKILGETLPVSVILVARFVVQAMLLVPLVWIMGNHWRSKKIFWAGSLSGQYSTSLASGLCLHL